jgi:hypothetical protein
MVSGDLNKNLSLMTWKFSMDLYPDKYHIADDKFLFKGSRKAEGCRYLARTRGNAIDGIKLIQLATLLSPVRDLYGIKGCPLHMVIT